MIIRTKDELGFVKFRISRIRLKLNDQCNVKGCDSEAYAIVLLASEDLPKFILCKYHFEKGLKDKAGWNYKLDFKQKKGVKNDYI